jgi:hypothetical protein
MPDRMFQVATLNGADARAFAPGVCAVGPAGEL